LAVFTYDYSGCHCIIIKFAVNKSLEALVEVNISLFY